MPKFSTMVDALRARAAHLGDRPTFAFLRNGDVETSRLTFAQLDARARGYAAILSEAVRPGDRVLLIHSAGLDFVEAFFGCLYAGAIAVPVSPPRRAEFAEKLRVIARDCDARAVLTDAACADRIVHPGELGADVVLALDAIDKGELEERGARCKVAAVDAATVALLQYTSGSTGRPKGVRVTHGNLTANADMINLAFGHDEQTTMVGWLPLFHDMGLVGCVMQPVYNGFLSVLMPPVAFIQRPARWLRAVSKYRATTSGGPNFGYELCAARCRPDQLEGVDLSSWRVAFNGAEPVRAATLARFTDAFAPYGFRPESHHPCYGMAEATLIVSGGGIDELPATLRLEADALARGEATDAADEARGAREVVCCGETIGDQIVRVVDPATCEPCPDSRVGEIWLRGPNISDGYWNKPDENAAVFGARIASNGDGPYLRTGDTGFLRGGRLYVTGRIKEIIILKGRNLYPHDIEGAVQRSHPAFAPGGGAAFSVDVDEEEERLVVVHELVRGTNASLARAEIIGAAREALAAEFDASLHDLVLIPPGALPKTSSGKIQRLRCRALYASGALQAVTP
jgi:acyl-CoA synthetase (AMP-forming)/AMP-acid ligase II